MELQFAIGKPNVRKNPLPYDFYASWVHSSMLNITQVMLENRTDANQQFNNDQLYRLEIECIFLVTNRLVRNNLFANQKGAFQIQTLSCHYIGVLNSFKFCFLDVSAC